MTGIERDAVQGEVRLDAETVLSAQPAVYSPISDLTLTDLENLSNVFGVVFETNSP